MFTIAEEDLELAIYSLRESAHDQAGRSQAPNLFDKEETDEWQLAEKWQKRLDNARLRRKVRLTNSVTVASRTT